MVNNFELIRPLLKFDDPDKFYFMQVIQRKKDAKEGQKITGTNNNARMIKFYLIRSLEYFDLIEDEVVQLCDLFNARAGIDLNRRSYRSVAFRHQMHIAKMMMNEHYDKMHKSYSSVLGKHVDENDKRWIIDLDGDEVNDDLIAKISDHVRSRMPDEGEDKIVARIPSKNGLHLITKPFDKREFGNEFPELDEIQKKNPTNLYIP